MQTPRTYDVLGDETIFESPSQNIQKTPLNDDEIADKVIYDLENEIKLHHLDQKHQSVFHVIGGYIKFITQFLATSTLIFFLLLVTTNYSAYITLARSYFFPTELQQENQSILNSVEASSLIFKERERVEDEKEREEQELFTSRQEKFRSQHSIKNLITMANKEDKPINIEITPFENRIVIPKIGKNIPLLDVKKNSVKDFNELQDLFMEELKNGVIRYPGSAKPGQDGTTFVFGHSSNFPWIKGDYNDVFALLDKVVYDDIIIVYYNQKKYTFKIREKQVVLPGDVTVLKRNKKKSEISLMTCWPIGTTLKRLIVTGELIEEEANDTGVPSKTVALK